MDINKVYLLHHHIKDFDSGDLNGMYNYFIPIDNELINYLIKHNFINFEIPHYYIDEVKEYLDQNSDSYDSHDSENDTIYWKVLDDIVRLLNFSSDYPLKNSKYVKNAINYPIEIVEPIINIDTKLRYTDKEFPSKPLFQHVMDLSINELNELVNIIDRSIEKN